MAAIANPAHTKTGRNTLLFETYAIIWLPPMRFNLRDGSPYLVAPIFLGYYEASGLETYAIKKECAIPDSQRLLSGALYQELHTLEGITPLA
jgi:hypothetical protein